MTRIYVLQRTGKDVGLSSPHLHDLHSALLVFPLPLVDLNLFGDDLIAADQDRNKTKSSVEKFNSSASEAGKEFGCGGWADTSSLITVSMAALSISLMET